MMSSPESDHNRLTELDKEALISIILTLQQTVKEQAAAIQSLRDQLAKNSYYERVFCPVFCFHYIGGKLQLDVEPNASWGRRRSGRSPGMWQTRAKPRRDRF
jgi:hypothetical protein